MSSIPTPRERPRRRAAALLASAATLVAIGAGQTPAVAEIRAVKMTVSLKAPTSVVTGDPVVVRGKVETRRAADLKLQGRTSRTTRWRTLDTARSSGRYRFEDVPTTTTWYRVVATRKSQRVRSQSARVVVTDPVLRWFDLYDLGTTGGDPDGFAQRGSIWNDWSDEYGYDGFVSEVDGLDTADWATFSLDGRCVRLTGAIGAVGPGGGSRVTVSGDGHPAVVDRDFGDDQWQRVDSDVTGVGQLRVTTERTEGALTTYLIGAKVRCDSRLGQLPQQDENHRWRALYDLGTVDGDPDGFAQRGSIWNDWSDEYGYDGFTAEVGGTDIEDWAAFAVPRRCTRLDAALGSSGDGHADVRITDQDGRVLHQREHGDDQWQRLDLGIKGVTRLQVTATSLNDDWTEVYLVGARIYCRRG